MEMFAVRAARELRTVPDGRPLLRLDLPTSVARQVFSLAPPLCFYDDPLAPAGRGGILHRVAL